MIPVLSHQPLVLFALHCSKYSAVINPRCLTHLHSPEENEIFFVCVKTAISIMKIDIKLLENWILYSWPLLCNGPRTLKSGNPWAINLLRIEICSTWVPLSLAGRRGECEQVSEVVWSKHTGGRLLSVLVSEFLPVQNSTLCVPQGKWADERG